MKLLVDMNLAPRWVAALTQAGHDAVHWSSVGNPTASDTEIMTFARAQGRVVVTHDLDFGNVLAATGGVAPSVIQIRSDDVRVEVVAPALIQALATCAEALDQGALVTIDVQRTRLRLLPLPKAR